jgi:hypothetical protein
LSGSPPAQRDAELHGHPVGVEADQPELAREPEIVPVRYDYQVEVYEYVTSKYQRYNAYCNAAALLGPPSGIEVLPLLGDIRIRALPGFALCGYTVAPVGHGAGPASATTGLQLHGCAINLPGLQGLDSSARPMRAIGPARPNVCRHVIVNHDLLSQAWVCPRPRPPPRSLLRLRRPRPLPLEIEPSSNSCGTAGE